MKSDAQQAQEFLHLISQAERTARRHSPNNGTVPLVWGAAIFISLASWDFLPFWLALGTCVSGPMLAAVWDGWYQRQLPVKPLKPKMKLVFGFWAIYHGAVLMGGATLGTHFWQLSRLPYGEWTLIGILDAAPLLWIGWDQRRRTLGGQP